MFAINERNKLYKEFIEEKCPDSKLDIYSAYKAKRNLVTSRLRKANQYFSNAYFEGNKNNVKETWKGIRNLINVSKKSNTNIDKIVENGKETTNPVEIADALSTFFVNIGKSVEQKIPKGKTPYSNYLRNRNIYTLLTPVLMTKLENIYPTFRPFLKPQGQTACRSLF